LLQLYIQLLARIEPSCPFDKERRQIRVDAPVAHFVGIGYRASTHTAAEAHVVELIAARAQTVFDVA
jgi:hypothetical protein